MSSRSRIRDALEIKDNDALFMIVFMMESYLQQYRKESVVTSQSIQGTSTIEIQKIEAHAKLITEQLTNNVFEIQRNLTQKLSDDIAGSLRRKSVTEQITSASIAAVMFGFVFVLGFSLHASILSGSTELPDWMTYQSRGSVIATVIDNAFRAQLGGYVVLFALCPLLWMTYGEWKTWRSLRSRSAFGQAMAWTSALLVVSAVTAIGF